MKNNFIKKTIVFVVILSVAFGFFNIIQPPKKAQAIWGVADAVFDSAKFWQTMANWAQQIGRWMIDDLRKGVRDMVVKRIMDTMVNQTIVWIQGGGEPKFVGDFQGFLKDAASAGAGDAILQTNAAFICSPFKAQIILGLMPAPTFGNQVRCTLDDIVGNIEDFYDDFNKGGWIGYAEVMQPQGNYYGTMLMVSANLNEKAAKAVDAASKEVQTGSGFLSVKRCKGGGYDLDAFEDNTPPSGYLKDKDGKYCLSKDMEAITPGDTVAQTVKDSIGSDAQWAANVQSYTAAIVNALISRLVSEGLANLTQADTDEDHAGIINDMYRQDKITMIDQIKPLRDQWAELLGVKNQSLNYAEKILASLTELKRLQDKNTPPISDCGPAITAADLTTAQSEINRIKGERDSLQAKISEAQNLVEKIGAADFSSTEIRLSTLNEFQNFSGKYLTQE